MFDLEKEIKTWKKSLYKYEVFEDGYIADIELHLRDAYQAQRESGLTGRKPSSRPSINLGQRKALPLNTRKTGWSCSTAAPLFGPHGLCPLWPGIM